MLASRETDEEIGTSHGEALLIGRTSLGRGRLLVEENPEHG